MRLHVLLRRLHCGRRRPGAFDAHSGTFYPMPDGASAEPGTLDLCPGAKRRKQPMRRPVLG